jgi:hypothetical protein
MSQSTNLDRNGTALLHIVHNLQHPTSRPTTKSMQTTMINSLKQSICHFRRINMANQQTGPPNNIIKRMKATAAWKQKESEPLGYCAACDPNRSFQI